MFVTIIKTGMVIQQIYAKLTHLERDIGDRMMLHNLYEKTKTRNILVVSKSNKNELLLEITPKIKEINTMISGINKISKLLSTNKNATKIDGKLVSDLISRRLDTIADMDTMIKLSNENFWLKLNNHLDKTRYSIGNLIDSCDLASNFDTLNKVEKIYRTQIENAIDIMSIGIYDISIFTVGRTVETALNKYINSLIKAHKLRYIDTSKTKYENKINLLHANNLIDITLFHKLNISKICRNDTGHPKKKIFKRENAISTINTGINVLVEIQGLTAHLKIK